jgi:hypothetical protein
MITKFDKKYTRNGEGVWKVGPVFYAGGSPFTVSSITMINEASGATEYFMPESKIDKQFEPIKGDYDRG